MPRSEGRVMSNDAQIHLDALVERGFSVIAGGIAAGAAADLLAAMHRLKAERSRAPDAEQPFLNRGHDVLYSLQREDVGFLRAFSSNALVMEILRGLLNDAYYRQIPSDRPNFILRSMLGRSSGPAPLPLHIDSFIPSSGQYCFACQVAIVLEDQTLESGCTVVVPGSHRADSYANQSAMSEAIPLETKAGDIVIWDGRIWHGALGNGSQRSRWSLISTFTRWWLKQNFDITGTLPQPVYDSLNDDEKAILGYCSRPPRDEFERIDIKAGHAQLKPRVEDYGRT
jgi:Phytanoyl-CoA dioxygenase (PhyH)